MWKFLLLAQLATIAMATPSLVGSVKQAAAANRFADAELQIRQFQKANGTTPEMIEALSWLGRSALDGKQFDKAEKYARETQELAVAELKKRRLDAEQRLPLALGAAIEVQAQVMAARGESGGAVAFLRGELNKYGTTSIHARIQKNINLLSLEGKPAPDLPSNRYLGPKPSTIHALHGRPILLFFWAHWCGDCKADGPIIAQLQRELSRKGLVIIAPTQHYGFAAHGEEVPPEAELKYIEQIRQKFYADMLDVPVPVSEAGFKNYGASTTPTLVLIDRQGIVRMYHPGNLGYEELRSRIVPLLAK